ncbi:MAG TPA: benzoate-CoA ligase family protein [Blastocatellia bacterium]|jgi:benzoate-CoA ligase|nr:benzoate-CoA ligase family protein [Blastocatellia bacterium]
MNLIPPYFNIFDYFLGEDKLARAGHRTAIEFRGGRITYRELRGEVDYWTEQIVGCGVEEGDRVALLLYDSPEFIACFLAAASVGAIGVPINTFIPPEEVMFILSDSSARVAIVEDDLEWKIDGSGQGFYEKCAMLVVDTAGRHYLDPKDEIAPRPPLPTTTRETPAFMLYTSGSTGAPKGVLHLHGSIPATVEAYSETILRLTEEDRIYSASRLFFAYGLGNSLSFPLAAGATVILGTERPSAGHLATLFEEQAPSVFFGVPALYRALLDFRGGRRLDVSTLRLCVSAGESLPPGIFEDWRKEFGLSILDGIGSTEMLHIFISNTSEQARAGSSGLLVKGYEARLTSDDESEAEPGRPANLWVRGASSTAGYWRRAELTRETIRDGWVRTGDIYRRDSEGFFYHVGRSDDCFKVRGLWVSPVEIESILLSHEAVSEAAVVAAVDGQGLATARAYMVIREGRDAENLGEELREFLSSRLPQYKVPTLFEFIAELPRTSTGKVQRYKLRAESRTGHRGGGNENR